jgi:hypothetical protein
MYQGREGGHKGNTTLGRIGENIGVGEDLNKVFSATVVESGPERRDVAWRHD